jgi:hypothetical protein
MLQSARTHSMLPTEVKIDQTWIDEARKPLGMATEVRMPPENFEALLDLAEKGLQTNTPR